MRAALHARSPGALGHLRLGRGTRTRNTPSGLRWSCRCAGSLSNRAASGTRSAGCSCADRNGPPAVSLRPGESPATAQADGRVKRRICASWSAPIFSRGARPVPFAAMSDGPTKAPQIRVTITSPPQRSLRPRLAGSRGVIDLRPAAREPMRPGPCRGQGAQVAPPKPSSPDAPDWPGLSGARRAARGSQVKPRSDSMSHGPAARAPQTR